jgi:hypothetical protein
LNPTQNNDAGEHQRRNLFQTTARTYLKVMKDFARHFHRPPDQLGREHIRSFQVYLLQAPKLSVRTVRLQTVAPTFLLQDVAEIFSG